MHSPPLKTGITWRPRPHPTPRPRCSPSRSLRLNVAPQKPHLSRMANPQHRKSLGVNDQRFPFLVHTKDFIFLICSPSPPGAWGFSCYGPHAFFRLVGPRARSHSYCDSLESNPFIVYNLHIFSTFSSTVISRQLRSVAVTHRDGSSLIVGLGCFARLFSGPFISIPFSRRFT